MADFALFPPPSSAQGDQNGDGAPLDEHYLSVRVQKSGKRRYYLYLEDHHVRMFFDSSLDDIRSEARRIKEKIVSHGDVIHSRWKKYSREKRAALLRATTQDNTKGAWQQVESWSSGDSADPWGLKEPCLGPIDWITHSGMVQLAEDHMRLLSLLHVRSEYEPQQWAAFDTRSARRGFIQDNRGYHRYHECSIIMHGKAYGKMKELNINAARSLEEVGFPRAWATFHMQKLLVSWLGAIVDDLTADAQPSGNSKWTEMLAVGLRSAHDQGLWSSYHHQEFAPPSVFDPDIILKKARDHLNMLVDEIELMQTSPEAMRQYVLEEKANTCMKNDKSQEEVWRYVSQTLALSWPREIERWQRLVAECEHLGAILAKSGITQVAGTRLSREADTAMRCFGRAIHRALADAASEWASQIRTIDIMSEHVRRMVKRKLTVATLDPKVHSHRIVYWCLQLAAAPEYDRRGSSWQVRKLKEQLEGTSYSRGLENWMSGIALLDEFAVLWTCRQTIDHPNPLDQNVIAQELESRDMVPSTFDVTEKENEGKLSNEPGDVECSRLLRHFCELPQPKGRKDLTWLKKTTETRRSLTDVWDCIRNIWDERQRTAGTSKEFRAVILSHMSFDISPEHLARVEAERQRVQDEDQRARALKIHQEQESDFVQQTWDLKSGTDGAVRKGLTKKSNAVRKDALKGGLAKLTLDDDSVAKDDESQPEPASVRRIAVKQDTLSVVSKLFSSGADGSSSVRWSVLLQALADVGLTITQGAGSAVSFANERGNVTYHMPHPEPILDAIRLRGLGRRLTKWFGWENETFMLREKGDEKP